MLLLRVFTMIHLLVALLCITITIVNATATRLKETAAPVIRAMSDKTAGQRNK